MAATYFYTNISVQIGIEDPILLQEIRTNLYSLGCRETAFTRDFSVLRDRLSGAVCDLLVVQADMEPLAKVCVMLTSIRHGDWGTNPFMPMIAVTSHPTAEQVKALVNAGVDDVLPHPWPATYVESRLHNLIQNRKPFVVTSDYIGPDRRQKPRPGEPQLVAPFHVPNALKAKAQDRIQHEAFHKDVQEAAEQMNLDKIARLAELIVRLAGELSGMAKGGQFSSELMKTNLKRIVNSARTIIRRAEGTTYVRRCSACNTLSRTATVMCQALDANMEPELHLLETPVERFASDFGVSMVLFHEPLTKGVVDKRIAAARKS